MKQPQLKWPVSHKCGVWAQIFIPLMSEPQIAVPTDYHVSLTENSLCVMDLGKWSISVDFDAIAFKNIFEYIWISVGHKQY